MTDSTKKNSPSTSDSAVNQEESVVSESQKMSNILADISKLDKAALLNLLKKTISEGNPLQTKQNIEQIKAVFYKLHRDQNEALKNRFVESGEKEEHFKPPADPIETEFKSQLKSYKEQKAKFIQAEEEKRQSNLHQKKEIIEGIKALCNKEEALNNSFEEYKQLQNKWRTLGHVPSSDTNSIWESYHLACELFYNYVNINKELRDLDLKKNTQAKSELIEVAKKLLERKDVIAAFKELQELHNRWREIGPSSKEDKELLWNNFKEVSSEINKKHHQYFEDRKAQLVTNYETRIQACETLESYKTEDLKSHKQWDTAANEIKSLQATWKKMGPVAKKDLVVFDRFRKASDVFFEKKKVFYAGLKDEQKENFAKKRTLCEQAEAIPHEESWKENTQAIINLQKEWKKSGPVSKKQGDALWERFRKASDKFFDAKDYYFKNIDNIYEENLKKKEAVIENLDKLTLSEDHKEALEQINEVSHQWDQIGFVDKKNKEELQNKYQKTLNTQFDKLGMDQKTQQRLLLESKLQSWIELTDGQSKIRNEYDRLRKKLNTVSNDLNVLENNIGFFNISKGKSSMIDDFTKKIEQSKEAKESIEQKIRLIKKYIK